MWRYAHGFVRGRYRKEEESSFFLLTKVSHDVDLITMWMGERRCIGISSSGSLVHFHRQKKCGLRSYWQILIQYVFV